MTIECEQKDGVSCLTINEEMTIYTAMQQKNSLCQYLADRHPLHIDLSGVTEIDSAGLQILLLLKQEAANRDIELQLVHHSQAVVEALELFNLSTQFGDPLIISAEWKKA